MAETKVSIRRKWAKDVIRVECLYWNKMISNDGWHATHALRL